MVEDGGERTRSDKCDSSSDKESRFFRFAPVGNRDALARSVSLISSMKLTTALLALGLLTPSLNLLQADEQPEHRTISVSGVAERSLAADEVEIHVQVRSVRKTLAEAQVSSEAVFTDFAKTLAEFGLKDDAIELRDHRLGKEYQRGPNGQQINAGYYSERVFLIKLADVTLLEAVYTELAENGDTQVSSTNFSRTDEIEIRKELRINALKAAKEKAEAMAEVYGQTVGLPISVVEGGTSTSPSNFATRNVMAFESGSSAQGRVNLSASVNVTFELKNQ